MYPKVAYCSHHKCATKWFLNYFNYGCLRLGWKMSNVHSASTLGESAIKYCSDYKVDFLFFSNAEYSLLDSLSCPIVHLIRDPRDIIISGYFSHLGSHETSNWPELLEHRKKLQSVDYDEGLRLELDFSEQFLLPMLSWPVKKEKILTLKYENFSRAPLDTVMKILEHMRLINDSSDLFASLSLEMNQFLLRLLRKLNLTEFHLFKRNSLPAAEWLGHAYLKRFDKIRNDKSGHYRVGTSKQWEQGFSDELLARFYKKYSVILDLYDYK